MAISLPLTSIWATLAIEQSHAEAQAGPNSQRRRLWAGTIGGSGSNESCTWPSVAQVNSNATTLLSGSNNHIAMDVIDRMYPDLEHGLKLDGDQSSSSGDGGSSSTRS
jgi:hypothetical protein